MHTIGNRREREREDEKEPDHRIAANLIRKGPSDISSITVTPPRLKELILKASELMRLCRMIALRKRYVIWLCNKTIGKRLKLRSGEVTTDEIFESELTLVLMAQQDCYGLTNLQNIQLLGYFEALKRANVGKTELRRISKLSPYVDQSGILRVGGRLHRAQLPGESMFPAILPSRHHVTKLFVEREHGTSGHLGHVFVLGKLMRRFWIVHGTCAVKHYIQDCLFCKQRRGHGGQQLMAPLPAARVNPSKYAFQRVGVDLFGPLMIRVRRSQVKRWGAIFTCMSTRACHLEIVEDISTSAFISAFWRFSNRRGQCTEEVYSDNGTNFHGMNNEFSMLLKGLKRRVKDELKLSTELELLDEDSKKRFKILDHNRIEAVLAKKGISIKWNFNSPNASHQGGVYERCIRSVRHVMASIVHHGLIGVPALKHRTPSELELVSILIEVEAILNSRPITRISDDPNDWGVLTPQMLLTGVLDPKSPVHRFCKADEYRANWKFTQVVAEMFWERWITLYLPWLQERQKWNKTGRNMKTGDLVLVLGMETDGRREFPKAIVIETYPDEFGTVRNVKIRVATGQVYTRDITKLVLLEAFGDEGQA